MKYDYDLFVIGAGSGGVRAARIASLAGARVAVAEEYRIGGTCVIRGCVPKKLLVYGAEFSQTFADAAGFGWTVTGAKFDWTTLRDNVQKEVARLSAAYNTNLIKAGVTPYDLRRRFAGLDFERPRQGVDGALGLADGGWQPGGEAEHARDDGQRAQAVAPAEPRGGAARRAASSGGNDVASPSRKSSTPPAGVSASSKKRRE